MSGLRCLPALALVLGVGPLLAGAAAADEAGPASDLRGMVAEVRRAEALMDRVCGRLDELGAATDEPLFRRHLLSVRALTMTEHTRMQYFVHDRREERVRKFVEQLRDLHRGFTEGKADEWASYTSGRFPLLHAHFSWHDGCMTSYYYTLPDDWDPAKAYPIFIELHGASRRPWYDGVPRQYGLGPDADPAAHRGRGTAGFQQRVGYYFMPWGRGNLRFHGHGEYDVLESLGDMKNRFNVDEDRQYLFGFSMGGAGTWAFATRMPDRWAAITVFAGAGMAENPGVRHVENINNLPVYLFVGERDHLKGAMDRINRELIEAGTPPKAYEIEPGLGHGYSGKAQVKFIGLMQRHVRTRPERFSYVADTADHLGIWGVRMKRDLTVSAVPRMDVRIEKGKRTVHIETEGTEAIKVRMGERGLRLGEGEWTIRWNAEDRYTGPPADLVFRADGTSGEYRPGQRYNIWNREKW